MTRIRWPAELQANRASNADYSSPAWLRVSVAVGVKFGFTRRAYNRTGGLVVKGLDALVELDERLKAGGSPSDSISMKRSVAIDHFHNVQAVVHGGHPRIADQRAITKFLLTSRTARIEAEGG
jgi:hypothetical protein